MDNNNTLLKVEHITKKFGGLVAVNDISFELKKGSITGLILEKDGVIQNAKLIMLHKGENDLANKWITIDENREVKVLAE